jgi:hypothetical protein
MFLLKCNFFDIMNWDTFIEAPSIMNKNVQMNISIAQV